MLNGIVGVKRRFIAAKLTSGSKEAQAHSNPFIKEYALLSAFLWNMLIIYALLCIYARTLLHGMQFEAKNAQIKSFVSRNFKNLPYTVATKHQQYMCMQLNAAPGVKKSNKGDEVGKGMIFYSLKYCRLSLTCFFMLKWSATTEFLVHHMTHRRNSHV